MLARKQENIFNVKKYESARALLQHKQHYTRKQKQQKQQLILLLLPPAHKRTLYEMQKIYMLNNWQQSKHIRNVA